MFSSLLMTLFQIHKRSCFFLVTGNKKEASSPSGPIAKPPIQLPQKNTKQSKSSNPMLPSASMMHDGSMRIRICRTFGKPLYFIE